MMSNHSNHTEDSLAEFLNKKRKTLLTPKDFKRLQRICEETQTAFELSGAPLYPYTPHDDTHCERVEQRLYQLIPEKKMKEELSPEEIFLLLAAIWLHDIGMCPTLFADDSRVFRNKDATKNWNLKVRDTHAERSAAYIKEKGARLGLTDAEISHLMIMTSLHGHKMYTQLNLEPWITDGVGRPLLIAYLRLADALHIPYRGSNEEFKIYLSLGMGATSRFHWLKSRYAHNVIISPDEFSITVELKRPPTISEEEMRPLEDTLKNEVQDELNSIKDIIAKGGLSLYLMVECKSIELPGMSEGDERQLRELLKNIELFDPTLTPGAGAVINNVLKQIKLFLEPPSHPDEIISYLDDYRTRVLADILEQRPCHVFLKKIADKLAKALSSNTSDEERIETVRAMVNGLEAKRRQALAEIPKVAYGALADGSPILLYGYSDTIVKCIEFYLREKKQGMEIYVCEGRTKTTYHHNNRLAYCDGIKYAEELKKVEEKVNKEFEDKGLEGKVELKIIFVTDSCCSNLFTNQSVSKVLFGANGIGLTGRVSHTLGHLAIGDMAENYNIPIYVIADSMKIGYLREEPKLQRDNRWLTTDIAYMSRIKHFEDFNPREDVLTPDLIEMIITEKGQIKPTEVGRHAETDD